jgi:hypothetical protein
MTASPDRIFHHRRNTAALLAETPIGYGVEIDIRCRGDRLVVTHDPFTDGPDLSAWLQGYRHGGIIANVKEEGLEQHVLDVFGAAGVADFFFLDQSFPYLRRWAGHGERRAAVRVSEEEAIDTAMRLAGRVDWVWVDCFDGFWLAEAEARRMIDAGLKLCLVSPELQDRFDVAEIVQARAAFAGWGLPLHAACTKLPERWSD